MYYAVDDNDGSIWSVSPNTAGGESIFQLVQQLIQHWRCCW